MAESLILFYYGYIQIYTYEGQSVFLSKITLACPSSGILHN